MQKLLRSEEVAEILNVSKAKAYKLMAEGRLPVLRLGRSVRVRPVDLEEFVENNVLRDISPFFDKVDNKILD